MNVMDIAIPVSFVLVIAAAMRWPIHRQVQS